MTKKSMLISFIGMGIFFVTSVVIIIMIGIKSLPKNENGGSFIVTGMGIKPIWYLLFSIYFGLGIVSTILLFSNNMLINWIGIAMSILICIGGLSLFFGFRESAIVYLIPLVINIIGAIFFSLNQKKESN